MPLSQCKGSIRGGRRTAEEEEEQETEPEKIALQLINKALESNRVVIDFDVITFALLAWAIYTVGPERIYTAFTGFLVDTFSVIAEGIGNPLEAAGKGLSDWFNDLIGGVVP